MLIDQQYFSDKMDDSAKNLHSYPVNVVSVQIGWLINEPEGKIFLKQILFSDGLDIYQNDSI